MNDKKKEKENLFAKLAAQQAKAADTVAVAVEPPPAADPSPALPSPPPRVTNAKSVATTPAKKQSAVGKRNDPTYCQFNTYIPKALRRDVERALLDKEGLDNSSLVETLLRNWLKTEAKSK